MGGNDRGPDSPDSDSARANHHGAAGGFSAFGDGEFLRIFETLDDGVFVFDVERDGADFAFSFLWNNEVHESITGISTDEFLGASLDEILPGDQATEVRARYRRCVKRQEPIAYDETLDHQTGTVEWHTKLTPISESGTVTRLVGVSRDITDRKQRERELEQFRAVVDQTGHAVYITDTDGTIEYVNPAFEEITGYSEAEALGETPSILNAGVYDDHHYEDLWETIHSGEEWSEEITNERKDGKQLVFNQTISPITDDEGEPKKFVAVAQDITRRTEYEAELEEQRDNLEVLNQVLRHDIRNDLQRVLTHAETLDEQVATDRESVDEILASAKSAIELTNSVKDVSKVMLQAQRELKHVDLRTVILEEVRDVRESYSSAEIIVDGTVPSVAVPGDDMIGSVFQNLVINAIEHNDKETPAVTISTALNDDSVEVHVADNGPGISERQKRDVFEEGKKGLNSSGTGLGLYLVQTNVDRYDGEVWVEDNDPTGSIFGVRLPLAWSDSGED